MQTVYELAPVIADVISAHCPGTTARERFVRARQVSEVTSLGPLAVDAVTATAFNEVENSYSVPPPWLNSPSKTSRRAAFSSTDRAACRARK